MTRKRFVKLLMSRGFCRDLAQTMALIVQGCGMTYFGYYHGTNLNQYDRRARHDHS